VHVLGFRTATEWAGRELWSRHGVELRKRRAARAERRARDTDELQRKKDDDEKMQRTLRELEQQRQVLAFTPPPRRYSRIVSFAYPVCNNGQ